MLDAPRTDEEILEEARQSFADALPRIQGLASAYLKMRSSERKDEAIAEVVALSWRAYRDLALRGRDVVKLLGRIVEFAAKKVRSGGRLVGMHPVGDVMSPTARFRHGHGINTLPQSDAEDTAAEVITAMTDDTSPADEAVLNIDVQEWLETLDDRRREVAQALMAGFTTVDVGHQRGVTRAAIYLVRKDLLASWKEFTGEHL